MRSARSVRRPHTNHHGKNTRRNRGKLIKNARMRRKQWRALLERYVASSESVKASHGDGKVSECLQELLWEIQQTADRVEQLAMFQSTEKKLTWTSYRAQTLVYSPEVTSKKQAFNHDHGPPLKEVFSVNDEAHHHRAEKRKEKKLLAKQNFVEIRRLEHERKAKEREERRIKKEEEKSRKKELENQKWQEMQKKMRMQKESAEKEASQRKAAEAKVKKEATDMDEGNAKDKKSNEGVKTVKKATVSVEKSSPIDKRSAPLSNSEEEVEKKKQRMGGQPNDEEAAAKLGEVKASKPTPDMDVYEEGKEAKTKGGKTKKTSESDSGFHNDDHDISISEVSHVKKHKETHEKTRRENGRSAATEFVNGDVGHTVVKEIMCVIESAPLGDVPNDGSLQIDGEKKNEKNIQDEQKAATSPCSSVINEDMNSCHGETSLDDGMERNGQHKPLVENDVRVIIASADVTKSQDVVVPVSDVNKSPTPIHTDELTSTRQIDDDKETTGHTTLSTSSTRFAQNVEKLVEHVNTKMKHDIPDVDPSVKTLLVDEQDLLQKKKLDVVADHKLHITPLPLEQHLSRPTTPSRERLCKLLPKDIIFCSGLIDSHGENYAAMAADPRNVYKENVRGIQRKIRIFKESPHYQTYLRAKEEGRPIEDILAEEDQT